MKFRKILAIATVFLIALLVAGWLLRNSLIQRFSGPLLARIDIELVDVSLDVLATGDAQIGYLELVHAKGTTVTIENLTLPIGRAADGSRTYTAEKVTIITATRTDGAPFELARLIDQFLSLPDQLAGSEVQVAALSIPPYPTLHDLQWSLRQSTQTLQAVIGSMELQLGATQIAAREYEIGFSMADANADEHSVAGHLRRNNAGIAIAGGASLELNAWEPLAKLAGIVPDPVAISSGNALLEYEGSIPYDTNVSPSIAATLTPTGELRLGYANEESLEANIVVLSATPLDVRATFPVVEWQLQQEEAALRVSYDDWTDIPLQIAVLRCTSENRCTMDLNVSMAQAVLPFGSAEQLGLAFRQTLDFSTGTPRLEIQAGGQLTANGVKTDELNIELWEATLVSTASILIEANGWQIGANSVDARLDSLSVADDLLLSGPLHLENVALANLDDLATAEFDLLAPASRVETASHAFPAPGLQGVITQRGDDVQINFATTDLHENGRVQGTYNLDSGHGKLTISGAAMSFADTHLSARTGRWNKDWDLVAGVVAVAGQVSWLQNDYGTLSGPISVTATDIAGYFGDTAFTGLSTDLEVMFDGEGVPTVIPASVSVALVDVGLQLRNIAADYVLSPDFRSADITGLRMDAFDGTISADPFSIHTDKGSNTVIMRAESLDLGKILTLKEFDAVEVSGRIGAELPITISTEGITIAAGSLTGEAPGGVIRYLSGNLPSGAVSNNIDMVRQALSHFEYDTLTSELSYSNDGDLELAMQLKGRNPDMEGSRPVILNLNVQNNVPQMLKSLQAARAVEELLEKQLAE